MTTTLCPSSLQAEMVLFDLQQGKTSGYPLQKGRGISARIYGIYITIAIKEGNLCLLCTYKNDVAVRVLIISHLSRGPGGLGSVPALSAQLWSLERLLWEDCKFLPLLCSCTFELRLLPMVSQLKCVASMSASSPLPPWFCPRSSWAQVPGLILDLQTSHHEEATQTDPGYYHQQSRPPALVFLFEYCMTRATASPPQQADNFPASFCKDKAMDWLAAQ